jgi:hypothetical protein
MAAALQNLRRRRTSEMQEARMLSPILLAVVLAISGEIDNPNIDMAGYLRVAQEAAAVRQTHRLSEEEFLRMACEPGAVILDARSAAKFRELHVKGAVNLSFPDITAPNLRAAIPDPSTPVLIYCNNNFRNAEGPFPGKNSNASLNLSTYIALYTYGYRNVYELGPLIDIGKSKLPFEGIATSLSSSPSGPGAQSALGSR